jgi:hypothetical protein
MNKPKDFRHASDLQGLKPDPEYRRKLSDRMGPEGTDLFSALNWSLIPTAAGIGIGVTLAARRGLPPNHTLAVTYIVVGGLLGAIIFGGGAFLFIWGFSRGAGEGLGMFVQPKGDYQRDYSFEDSLVARGDVAGAIASFAKIADAEPDNLEVRLRAAELHRKHSAFEEASALYRDVQTKAQRPRDDVHASLRLIDLYLAWPEHEGRSMRELKRLIDKYPGTEIEKRSKAALANLKRERFPETA